jgi:hypothetical protein
MRGSPTVDALILCGDAPKWMLEGRAAGTSARRDLVHILRPLPGTPAYSAT